MKKGLLYKIMAPVGRFFRRLWNGRFVIRDLVKHRHRFIVLDTDTYKEKLSFQLSGINLFVFAGITALLLVVLTAVLLAFTPLRELIPGYTNTRMAKQTYLNAQIVDSLERQVAAQEELLVDIQDVMLGRDPAQRHAAATAVSDSAKVNPTPYTRSEADSLLRIEMVTRGGDMHYAIPLKGTVERKYNESSRFYGVDIVAKNGEKVQSIQDGVVLWAIDDKAEGTTMVIQHPFNFFSLYRGKGKLLKAVGDEVMAGEAVMQLSPLKGEKEIRLHFEMRQDGQPVDPRDFIKW